LRAERSNLSGLATNQQGCFVAALLAMTLIFPGLAMTLIFPGLAMTLVFPGAAAPGFWSSFIK
jgi:hypothetical protein